MQGPSHRDPQFRQQTCISLRIQSQARELTTSMQVVQLHRNSKHLRTVFPDQYVIELLVTNVPYISTFSPNRLNRSVHTHRSSFLSNLSRAFM